MSKRIPDIKDQILSCARKILLEEGYSGLSMRGLSGQCGIAVGTLYNYYRNKDELAANIMLEDWNRCTQAMATASGRDLSQSFRALCETLEGFTDRYQTVWLQYSGSENISYRARFHQSIRRQLEEPIDRVLQEWGRQELRCLVPVLAETMLSCAMNPDLGAESFGLLAASWDQKGIKTEI